MVSPELDRLPAADIVRLTLDAVSEVPALVRAEATVIGTSADLIARRLTRGGRLLLAGAGTSGRIAHLEARELPGTFGISADRVRYVLAGGLTSTDFDEDDVSNAEVDLADFAPTDNDVVIVVAASGSTPYTLALAQAARSTGAAVIAVVNVRDSRLARAADLAIEVVVGPEVIEGSTRLAAGTAQKLILDALTTAAFARLGRVHGRQMIDVVGANAKLRQRQVGIVATITGRDAETCRAALDDCAGDARAAVLRVLFGLSPDAAITQAAAHRTLRDAIESRSGNEAPSGS